MSSNLGKTPAATSPAESLDFSGFDGLIFDCDGTLADTMPSHFLAWTRTMDRHGLSLPEARFYAMGGMPAHRIIALLAAEQGVDLDPLAVALEKEAAFEHHIGSVRGIEPIIAIARRHRGQMPMAVATGGLRYIVEQCLRHLGILDWFDALVAAEDVEHHKPAPDTYLLAAKRLGVEPTRCCAFEDTGIGLAAAGAAGMTVIDVADLIPATPRNKRQDARTP